jgi:hypothetical protein
MAEKMTMPTKNDAKKGVDLVKIAKQLAQNRQNKMKKV